MSRFSIIDVPGGRARPAHSSAECVSLPWYLVVEGPIDPNTPWSTLVGREEFVTAAVREEAQIPDYVECKVVIGLNKRINITSMTLTPNAPIDEAAVWLNDRYKVRPYFEYSSYVSVPHNHPAAVRLAASGYVSTESLVPDRRGINIVLRVSDYEESDNPADWTYVLRITESQYHANDIGRKRPAKSTRVPRTEHRVPYLHYEGVPKFNGWAMLNKAIPSGLKISSTRRLNRETFRKILSVRELDSEIRRWSKEFVEYLLAEDMPAIHALVHTQVYKRRLQCFMGGSVENYYRRQQERLVRKWMRETGRPRKEVRLNKRPEVRVGRKGESEYYV